MKRFRTHIYLLMEQPFEESFQSEQQQQNPVSPPSRLEIDQLPRIPSQREKEKVLDPPRQLPNRSYSLEPDMANGWKPRNSNRNTLNNVFSINYEQELVDDLVRQLYKAKNKGKDKLVYLGPRRNNSYVLHENRSYVNPYPIDKKQDQLFSGRKGLPQNPKFQQSFLKFDSDFECGNLDLTVQRGQDQFDLFMRVDTNTRGHTNWYYFSVSNSQYIGSTRFNICNFRREKSLYQRGLKPYVYSKLHDSEWQQGGKNVTYQRKRPKYDFLYEDCDSQDQYIKDQTHI